MKKVLLALSAVAFLACNKPAEESIDLAAVRAEIEALELAYSTAQNAKDVDGLMVYYAEDAQSLPHGKPTLVGKAAIRKHIESEFADLNLTAALSATTVDVWASGSLAVETGIWQATAGDGSIVMSGKYMALFEKRDGKYICIRDTWNADYMPTLPAATSDTTAAPAI